MNAPSIDPAKPTDAPPASKRKIEVLRQRASRGLPLWNPDDSDDFSIAARRMHECELMGSGYGVKGMRPKEHVRLILEIVTELGATTAEKVHEAAWLDPGYRATNRTTRRILKRLASDGRIIETKTGRGQEMTYNVAAVEAGPPKGEKRPKS